MPIDTEEKYESDSSQDMQMSEELQYEAMAEQQAAAETVADIAAAEQATPTGAQQPSPEQSQPPTGERPYPIPEGVDTSAPDFEERYANYVAKLEENKKFQDPRFYAEQYAAIPVGVVDFATDLINMVPGVEIPKMPEFQYKEYEAARNIASVVVPTMATSGVLGAAGKAANTRVGWGIGQNKFMQWIGNRGVESLAGLGVGVVSSEYEGDNLTGTLKKSFPKTYDFVPDSVATLDTDSPDEKRQKNIREDIGGGMFVELLGSAIRFGTAIGQTALGVRRSNKLVGETAESRKWLSENSPKPRSDDPEAYLVEGAIKQEEALDEVGAYNLMNNPNMDVALKGVHDLFDYSELGVRTVDDFGIVGASIDQVRVARNLDSVNGRMGNIISEPALKYGLQSAENSNQIVMGLADQLHKAGEIGMEGGNWKVTFKDVIDENENLAISMIDPRMSKADIRKVLEPHIVRKPDGTEVLVEEGFEVASKALRQLGSEVTGMDMARAQSLLAGSLSGRVSDIAEGARLMDGTPAVKAAQEKVIDLMQHITQLTASAKYYKNRKMNLIQMVQNGFKNVEGYTEATALGAGETAQRIFQDSQRFGSTMRMIADNQPELMDQFLMAYELTDGRIDTIAKMNQYIFGMTADLGKGIINLNPEVENKLIAGVWSNVYNSILSAFVTPIQAMVGNSGGIVSQPVSHFAGAIMAGDLKAVQRGWMAYSSIGETMQRALPYAGDVFMKASREPDAVRSGTRLDLLLQSEREMDFLKQAARTQKEQGNDGLEYIVNQIEMLNDLGKDPILRFGPNAMTALDGFTGVFNASAEARFRAMDELVEAGKPVTKENLKPIADKYYSQMFGSDGMLSDEAVKYATGEMALNLDTPLAQGVTDLTKTVPGLKPFLMFPTTGMNLIDVGGKYNPIFTPFQRDINELAYTPLSDLLGNEARIDDLLRARNINPDNMDVIAKQNRIADLKYTTRGRKAMGFVATTSAIGLLMNGRLTGDGLMDREAQRSREKQSGWKKRSIIGLDGKYYSYEWLGPLADWVAFVANVGDNFDMLGQAQTERFFEKAMFILGASVTDRTGLSTLKPLMDMLSGNPGAGQRWAAGFTNSLGPLAGQRGEWSRIFSQGLMETNDDFLSAIANRNRFLIEFDPANRAPYVYSPVTGKKANGYGLMQRAWNALSPLKIHAEQSPEEKFLQDIEYDYNTTFKTKNGVKLTATERSELFRIMGEQDNFRRSINEIMRDAGDWNSIARMRNLRRQGKTSEEVSLKQWDHLHIRLNQARRVAEALAYQEMDSDMFAAIEARQIQQERRQQASGEGAALEEPLNIRY